MHVIPDTFENAKKILLRLYYNYNTGKQITVNLKNLSDSDNNTNNTFSTAISPSSSVRYTLRRAFSCEFFTNKYEDICKYNCYNKLQSNISNSSLEKQLVKSNSEYNISKLDNMIE